LDLITETSLVYAIHCYIELYLAVSEKARPAMVVMNDLEEYVSPGKMIPEGLQKMVEDCEEVEWPEWGQKGDGFRADFAFTKIWWRKGEQEILVVEKLVEEEEMKPSSKQVELRDEQKADETTGETATGLDVQTAPPEEVTDKSDELAFISAEPEK
jgi:hypothetical protein